MTTVNAACPAANGHRVRRESRRSGRRPAAAATARAGWCRWLRRAARRWRSRRPYRPPREARSPRSTARWSAAPTARRARSRSLLHAEIRGEEDGRREPDRAADAVLQPHRVAVEAARPIRSAAAASPSTSDGPTADQPRRPAARVGRGDDRDRSGRLVDQVAQFVGGVERSLEAHRAAGTSGPGRVDARSSASVSACTAWPGLAGVSRFVRRDAGTRTRVGPPPLCSRTGRSSAARWTRLSAAGRPARAKRSGGSAQVFDGRGEPLQLIDEADQQPAAGAQRDRPARRCAERHAQVGQRSPHGNDRALGRSSAAVDVDDVRGDVAHRRPSVPATGSDLRWPDEQRRRNRDRAGNPPTEQPRWHIGGASRRT